MRKAPIQGSVLCRALLIACCCFFLNSNAAFGRCPSALTPCKSYEGTSSAPSSATARKLRGSPSSSGDPERKAGGRRLTGLPWNWTSPSHGWNVSLPDAHGWNVTVGGGNGAQTNATAPIHERHLTFLNQTFGHGWNVSLPVGHETNASWPAPGRHLTSFNWTHVPPNWTFDHGWNVSHDSANLSAPAHDRHLTELNITVHPGNWTAPGHWWNASIPDFHLWTNATEHGWLPAAINSSASHSNHGWNVSAPGAHDRHLTVFNFTGPDWAHHPANWTTPRHPWSNATVHDRHLTIANWTQGTPDWTLHHGWNVTALDLHHWLNTSHPDGHSPTNVSLPGVVAPSNTSGPVHNRQLQSEGGSEEGSGETVDGEGGEESDNEEESEEEEEEEEGDGGTSAGYSDASSVPSPLVTVTTDPETGTAEGEVGVPLTVAEGGGTQGRQLQRVVSVLNGAFFVNGPSNFQVNRDRSVSLSLSRSGGNGFTSRRAYPFGKFSVNAKMPRGYSAGVCTTFFLISGDYDSRGEWDFEFLGSATDGAGMTLQTNYFEHGIGKHEVLSSYGFDPTADFHTYTIDWQPNKTTWYVDDRAIRTVTRTSRLYPSAPMTVAVSIWDASEWATGPRDHRVPVDYRQAPFTATFRNFQYTAYRA